ncbi:hypothetical protein MXM82_11525 [Pseudomonas asiatica]|uniref:hypothetical protein n=1 Tax=Pseudomonas asiatica TaxID=2219225 RepID=UPI002DBA778C|nr:hypothetical protein [Pseudomonas asiatica]MEB6589761.1 hypothetical protein [Pseudomonas asiatica]
MRLQLFNLQQLFFAQVHGLAGHAGRAERPAGAADLPFPWLTWLVIGAYRYEALMTAGVTVFILLVYGD